MFIVSTLFTFAQKRHNGSVDPSRLPFITHGLSLNELRSLVRLFECDPKTP